MVSKLEKAVRKRDNLNFRIPKLSEAISLELGAKRKTIETYLQAKRAGYNSYTDYKKGLVKEAGFKNYAEYMEFLAKKKGYSSCSEHQNVNAMKRNFRSKTDYNNQRQKIQRTLQKEGHSEISKCIQKKQELFEENIEYVGEIEMGEEQTSFKEMELRHDVQKLLETLDERRKRIIEGIYFYGETTRELGGIFGITQQRVSDLEKEAIQKLRKIGTRMELNPPLDWKRFFEQ